MKKILVLVLFAIGVAVACAPLPDIGNTVPVDIKNRPFSEFLTIDQLQATQPPARTVNTTGLEPRIRSLRGQAARLRRPVLTPAEQRKLQSRTGVVRGQILTEQDRARLLSRL